MMEYFKYHALGNDYIVINPAKFPFSLTREKVRLICDRHFGLGSDGILYGPHGPVVGDNPRFSLRIFNPDGSEAEKSGNGLRIFSRYLWDEDLIKADQEASIETVGGEVKAAVTSHGRMVRVEMGQVSFWSSNIPVAGRRREVIQENIKLDSDELSFCAVTIGNPHCVVLMDEVDADLAMRYGPVLEVHPLFPNRTNVQFMKIIDRQNIYIEIWERGAGYTLASGSSSCAAASVAYRLGLCDSSIMVHMKGGSISIEVSENYEILMTGPVTQVAKGVIMEEMFESLPPGGREL